MTLYFLIVTNALNCWRISFILESEDTKKNLQEIDTVQYKTNTNIIKIAKMVKCH